MKYDFLNPSMSFTTSFPVVEKELPPLMVFEITFAPFGKAVKDISIKTGIMRTVKHSRID